MKASTQILNINKVSVSKLEIGVLYEHQKGEVRVLRVSQEHFLYTNLKTGEFRSYPLSTILNWSQDPAYVALPPWSIFTITTEI